MKNVFLYAFILSASLTASSLFAMHWGDITPKHCTSWTTRLYSAILWDIPWGDSWEKACRQTPGYVNGEYKVPSHCPKPFGNQWGEWVVTDMSCSPSWGTLQRGNCMGNEMREYWAYITVPYGESYSACTISKLSVPLDDNNQRRRITRKPDSCTPHIFGGHIGRWEIPDPDKCD